MPRIRSLTAEDDAQVLALNAAARLHVAPLDRAELSRLRGLGSSHLVAAQGDAVVGYLLGFDSGDAYDGEEFLELRARLGRSFVYVDQVVVLASARGSGVGRSLYEALERIARERNRECLCCEVNTSPENPGSLAFHARLGFAEIGTLTTRDGREVVLLRRPIAKTPGLGGRE